MVKTRGLKEANKKLGNIDKIISNFLKKKKKIRIFESGCGYGKVMIELSKKYGSKIDIVGMNLKSSHGNKKVMINFALSEGIVSKKDIKVMKIPKIIYGDAGERLPFKSGSIDLVYSQTSSYLYKDKLHFFEEVARILSKEGIARITIPENPKIPEKYLPLLRIYDDKKMIPFEKFIKDFKKIKLKKYVEIRNGKLNFNLKLKSILNLNKINKDWFGIQSTYMIK